MGEAPKPLKFKMPGKNTRTALDKLFKDQDAGALNQREKTQSAREAARMLADELDKVRK
ncbi:MAG TPA: hypothetical protein VGG10_02970 [Rhizomicrobium sp.]|jgi:hypothetical protein